MIDIGNRIRQLRIQNGLTLQELASRTELTKGYLSQLERNLTMPSLPTLSDICEALGTPMSRFFAEDEKEQVVFTQEDAFVDAQENRTIHWIVPNAQKNEMEPILLELRPGARTREVEPHEGEEFGYVMSGRIFLVRQPDKKGILVKKGEVFYIQGNKEHFLENRGGQTAVVLWISTPPAF